jgi:PPOX class probable F420-dependent enzyme
MTERELPSTSIAPEIAEFLDSHPIGVLATVSEAGRPRQSVVYFARTGDRLLVSTLAGRWKARDVERSGWASLAVRGNEPPYPSATLAGAAAIIREGVGSLTALVAQRVMGLDEPPEPQPEEALAAAGRVILSIDVEQVGPVSYIDATSS